MLTGVGYVDCYTWTPEVGAYAFQQDLGLAVAVGLEGDLGVVGAVRGVSSDREGRPGDRTVASEHAAGSGAGLDLLSDGEYFSGDGSAHDAQRPVDVAGVPSGRFEADGMGRLDGGTRAAQVAGDGGHAGGDRAQPERDREEERDDEEDRPLQEELEHERHEAAQQVADLRRLFESDNTDREDLVKLFCLDRGPSPPPTPPPAVRPGTTTRAVVTLSDLGALAQSLCT